MATLMIIETQRLEECEDTIRKGMSTFVEVGQALAAIRDQKLYRDTHKTFQAYCKERWGRSRDWAYMLMNASAACENVDEHQQIPNQEQAKALSKAPPEEQAEVWAEVLDENGEHVTAADVTKAVHIRLTEGDVPKSDIDEMAEPFKQSVLDIDRIRRNLHDWNSGMPLKPHIEGCYHRIDQMLQNSRDAIRMATPVGLCPKCKGLADRDECGHCMKSGIQTRIMAKR
jgi:hypothetical protein